MEDWRIKLSVLWLVVEGAFLAYLILMFMEPGVIDQLISGKVGTTEIGQGVLLLFAIIALAPLIMALLSLFLKYSVSCWANTIVGILLAIFEFIVLIGDLTQSQLYAYAILLGLSKLVLLAMIVWYAWKSKQKA